MLLSGLWQCPVTNKVFTQHSHVVCIKSTGNVFSYEAVFELNIKPKNYIDLISGEEFKKNDIITLQNPNDEEHMKLRDISNFSHLETIREDNVKARLIETKIRFNPTAEKVLKEMETKKDIDNENKRKLDEYVHGINSDKSCKDDVKIYLDLKPTIDDVNPGEVSTDGKASSSFTSTVMTSYSSNATRLANAEEIRDALWKQMRILNKKGYVQFQTNMGNINLEIHCDIAPRTSWNFITLCKRGYYKETIFHRLVTGFMVQGGDPTGTGTGGESAWGGEPFKDEFDTRILHDARGVLSMANAGINSNGSQFFILLKAAKHLDLKHSVFGRVVGGAATIDRIEAIGNDKKESPLSEIKISDVVVFTNPIEEAEANLTKFITANIQKRLSSLKKSALPTQPSSSSLLRVTNDTAGNDQQALTKRLKHDDNSKSEVGESSIKSLSVGKYLSSSSSSNLKTASKTSSSAKLKPAATDEGRVAAFMKSQQSNASLW